MIVGQMGDGTLNINGGRTSARNIWVAELADSTGNVVQDGGRLEFVDMTLGGQGTTPGGTAGMMITGGVAIGVEPQASDNSVLRVLTDGMLTLDGGTLEVGMLELADPANFAWQSGTLDLDQVVVIQPGELLGGDVSIGAGKTLRSALIIGDTADGMLTIESGGNVSGGSGRIGDEAGVSGAVTVDGGTWNPTSLTVARAGPGVLTIDDGGVVGAAQDITIGAVVSGDGTVTVDNATLTSPSTLRVGQFGPGTLSIRNGALVASDQTFVGDENTVMGSVLVDGANSRWNSNTALTVSDEGGMGTVTVQNQAAAASGHTVIGNGINSTGTFTVDGIGSTWDVAELTVGNQGGSGAVMLTGSSTSTSLDASLGATSDSVGTVDVAGAGSTWSITGRLAIGGDAVGDADGGAGSVTIAADGRINVTEDILLFPDGVLEFSGGTLASDAIDDRGGQFDWTGGTLQINSYDGNLTNQGGVLVPGQSIGNTSILGNYAHDPSAKLEIEVAGILPGQFDTLAIEANFLVDGELEVLYVDEGNVLVPGNTVTIVTTDVGLVSGQFAIETMPVFDDLTFDVIYNPTNIVLEVVRALPGDYDQDGDVDGDDFWIWQQDPSLGPLSDWEEHYGTSLESAANVRTTESPEPSSALVAIVTTLLGVSFELYRPQRS